MKKKFLILITFFSNNYYAGGGGSEAAVVAATIVETDPGETSSYVSTVASNPGLASVLSSTDNVLSNLGNSPVIQWITNNIGAPIGALIEGVNITTGSSINNNTTNQTPGFVPTSPTPTCVTTNQSENPYYAVAGCSGKTTVQCLLASAEAAVVAGGLPILGLDVTGPKGPDGKWPVIVQTYIINSSSYVNNSCVNGSPYSPSSSMAGLLNFGNTSGSLTPFYTYITNCLEEGKTDTTKNGRSYNNKVFFNNANATFNGTSVNPIQCMACGTTGSISSCNTVVNDANNPYPASATQAPTTTNQLGWGNQSAWDQNQYGQLNRGDGQLNRGAQF